MFEMSCVRQIDPFCSWMDRNSIYIDFDFVEIRSSNPDQTSPYWSIFAKKDVPEGSILAWIPKSALLSPRNSQLQRIMEEESIGSGLALVITLMYERSRKEDSKWSGYLESLPEREYLPVFWSEEELEPLKSTPLFNAVYQEREFMEEDFIEIVKPLMEKFPAVFEKKHKLTLEDFKNAASIVSSRDFYVDSEHERALVPLADVFNHKCCIVANEDHVLQAELPDYDHKPRADLDQIDPEMKLEIVICNSANAEGVQGLEIKTAQFIPKGNEIHNTYGELSNSTLLMKYGFCLHQNPFDCVSIDIHRFLTELENSLKPLTKTTSSRFQLLKDAIDEEELTCFRLFPDGKCCGPLASILEFLFSSYSPQEEEEEEEETTLDLELDTPPINIPHKSYQHTKALSKSLLKLMEIDGKTQSSMKALFESWNEILSQGVSYLESCLGKGGDLRNSVVSLQQEEDLVYNSKSSSSHRTQRDRKQDFVKIWCRTD